MTPYIISFTYPFKEMHLVFAGVCVEKLFVSKSIERKVRAPTRFHLWPSTIGWTRRRLVIKKYEHLMWLWNINVCLVLNVNEYVLRSRVLIATNKPVTTLSAFSTICSEVYSI
jgi:hypothetical protein